MNPKWISLGIKIYPLIAMAVHMVEKVAGAKRGKEKQDAALEAIAVGLNLLETGVGKDLIDDPEVNAALRAAVDAYVHVQNVIAKKKALAEAAGPTVAPV